MGSNQSITGGSGSTCTQQSGSNVNLTWANYSTANNNQMTTTVQAPGGVTYDAAGDITNDGHVGYLYNADGQVCAIQTTYDSMTVMFGYIYDADGNRVAKGTITTWSCDPSGGWPSLTHFDANSPTTGGAPPKLRLGGRRDTLPARKPVNPSYLENSRNPLIPQANNLHAQCV